MKKKISYVELLKEAIQEYDTKSFDVKGPMLDPIISYNGGGELETHKDASSVLERFYFKEKDADSRVFVEQDVQEKEPEENEIETGEEADSVDATMDDLEDELLEDFMLEDDADGGDLEDAADVPSEFEKEEGGSDKVEGIADVTESMEQAVIEKLISEMEEAGPEKEIEPEDDEETKEAGTGLADEKEVDKVVEELELEMLMLEQEEEAKEEEKKEGEEEGEEEKDLDVDAKIKTEASNGRGIVNNSSIEEAFKLFKEQIEDSEEKDEDKKEDEEKEGEEKEDDELKEADDLEEDFMFEDDELEGDEKEGDEKEVKKDDELEGEEE